jgi:DNA-binding response OmpR family regulator
MVWRDPAQSMPSVTELPQTPTIVAIAKDSALLRSLAFALEAHGYRVKPFRSWQLAKSSTVDAFCVVLDSNLPASDKVEWLADREPGVGTILLAEDDLDLGGRDPGVIVLNKPLAGPDVLSALATLKARAR